MAVWLPSKFLKAGPHLLVHLVDGDLLDMRPGFFKQTLKRLPPGKNPGRIMPLGAWLETCSGRTDVSAPWSMIFHTARCGSTLLCQNLKATGEFQVLSEPEFFGHLYSKGSLIHDDIRHRVALHAMGEWNRWAHSQGKLLVIKHLGNQARTQAAIRGDFPDSPALFLYREPVANIESLVHRPPKYMELEYPLTDLPEIDPAFTKDIAVEVVRGARLYLFTLEAMPEAIAPGVAAVDYRNLEGKFDGLLRFFNTRISPHPINNPGWSAQWNAKKHSESPEPYLPLDSRLLDEFHRKNRVLLDHLRERYVQAASRLQPEFTEAPA